ncbi:thioredoxin [bacterium]|nr:thioredoxin [bacterium]
MHETTFDFQKEVIDASQDKSVIVDFWAEWCGPCKMLGPVLEKLADEAGDTWTLVKVNTEEHPQIAMEYRIQGIPAVKMFSGGEVIAEFVGALPETQVRRWLEENIPTESKKLLQEANQALDEGDREKAQSLLKSVYEDDPENSEARILLAELIFDEQPNQALDLVANTPPGHPLQTRAEAIQTLVELMNNHEALTIQAEKTSQNTEAWSQYLSGIQALKRKDYGQALKSWIDSILVDRTIDDDGPRRACVALFTWLGHEHELTKRHHRAFTSALF